MKKISIILACVIIAVSMISCPIVVRGYNTVDNTVTAEATEEVVVASATTMTTEATTEQVEETTVVETTVTTAKATTRPSTTKKQESKTTKKSSTTKAKSTTEKTTEKKKKDSSEEKDESKNYFEDVELQYSAAYNVTSHKLTKSAGVNRYNGSRETWYSQRVLPGNGLNIPGRHVADDGTVRDGEGYICIAADPSYLARGSRVMTSLGPAKVYDCGCAYGTVDIYVNW